MTQTSVVKGPVAIASDDAQWVGVVVSDVRSVGIGW